MKRVLMFMVVSLLMVGMFALADAANIRGYSAPAAGTAASVTIAASGTTLANQINSVAVSISGGATVTTVVIRDGASGTGPIIWEVQLPGAAGTYHFMNLNVTGSINTATTVEFTAGVASQTEVVSVTGVQQ